MKISTPSRKYLSITFCTIVTFYCTAIISPATAFGDVKEIKIGAILPLTGPLGSVGMGMLKGIQLGIKDAKNLHITLRSEDDQTANRTEALTAVKKLVSVDRVDILLNAYASTLSIVGAETKKSNTPCIVIWDSNRALPSMGNHLIGFGYGNELAGEDMAEFAVKKLNKKTGLSIYADDEWSEVISNAFVKKFEELGGSIKHERVLGTTTDFKTLLAKAKSSKVDVLYLPLFGNGIHSVIKQIRDIKLNAEILTPDGFGESDISAIGASAEGVYATEVWFDNDEFRKKVEAEIGASEASNVNLGYVALGYDTVKMISEIVEKIGSFENGFSAQRFLDAAPGFTFNGILGNSKILADRTVERRQKILRVENGKFQPVVTD